MTYLLLDSRPTLYCQAYHGKLLNFIQGNIFVAKATIILQWQTDVGSN